MGSVDNGYGERESSLERRTIVYFSAPWCTPCKKLAPLLDKVVVKYRDDIDFIKVNVDDQKPMAEYYGIKSIPTFVLIKSETDWEMTPVTVNPQFLEGYFYKALIKK